MNLQVGQAMMEAAIVEWSEPVPQRPHQRVRRNRPAFESDAAYFRRRASEERAFAHGLTDARARALHIELADRYASLAAAIREAEEQIG